MNSGNLLHKDNLICSYKNRALTLMQVYKLEENEEFSKWLNRFEYVAGIISIPPDKMVEFFNHMVDTDVHTCVKKTYPNVDFSKHPYEVIMEHYFLVFSLPHEIDLNRKRFISRKQYENESILEYYYNLLKLLNKCFCPSNFEEQLCEQFINGLRDEDIRNHLKEKPCLSFDGTVVQAIEFCKNTFLSYYKDLTLIRIYCYNLGMEGDFCDWLNQFEYVADSIRVPDKLMVELFKNMVDNNVHTYFKQANPKVDISDSSYEEITKCYLSTLSKSNETDSYRKRLQYRYQYEGETIEKFADKLEKLYNKCYNKEQLIFNLCRQFCKGIRNDDIKKFLSKYLTLSFYEMVSKAVMFQEVDERNNNTQSVPFMMKTFESEKVLDFCDWLNNFECLTFGLPNVEMISLFNKLVNNDVHKRVKEKYSSVNFSELSYEQIIDHYLRFFSPTDEMFLHRRRFFCRDQYEEETLQNYAYCLQKIHSNCNYTCYTDERLSDQFVSGIRDSDIKQYLEKFPYLSFDETVAKAIEFVKANEINKYINQALLWMNIYDPKKDIPFSCWFNKFESVAIMIKVPEDKMIAFFNKMVNTHFYRSVQTKFHNVNFSELSYDKILEYFIYFITDNNQTRFHRYRFKKRYQYEEETIENYYQCLRKIFIQTLYEDIRVLRNRFLNGMLNYEIKTSVQRIHVNKFNRMVGTAIHLEKLLKERKKSQ